jgi:transposase InsO family protein
MTDDEFEALARHVRETLQNREIVHLEQQFSETPPHTEVPWPGTEHPSLEHCADFVRDLMARGEYMIHVAKPSGARGLVNPDVIQDTTPPVTTLTVRKAWAPATDIGDRFVYVWRVAMDSAGRHVASKDVQIRVKPE